MFYFNKGISLQSSLGSHFLNYFNKEFLTRVLINMGMCHDVIHLNSLLCNFPRLMDTGGYFFGAKWQEHEADHSLLFTYNIWNVSIVTTMSPICFHGMVHQYKGNFTFSK